MLVSAISVHNSGYRNSNGVPFSNLKNNEPIRDTAFNSLTSSGRKHISQDKMPLLFDNINEWKNFCHKQILGEKLDFIA